MSISAVREALELFATTEKKQAIVLKGDWGTGKTHLWNSIIKQKKERFHLDNYCYVSLFGISNLKDLKRCIFENIVSKKIADQPASFKDTISNFENVGSKAIRLFKKTSSSLSDVALPYTKTLGNAIEAIQFSSIRSTLICIDDFERKSSSLHDKEVLGLISHLVENKNCRILLILNSNTINPDSDYFKFHEKVFDYEIEFSPSTSEACRLIFDESDAGQSIISKNIAAIGTSNIRLYKKINRLCEIILPHIKSSPRQVQDQVLSTLTLSVWSIYSSDPSAISIDFIKKFTGSGPHHTPSEDPEIVKSIREAQNKTQRLLAIGFMNCDDLDRAVINFVEKGYIDKPALEDLIYKVTQHTENNEKIQSYRNIWQLYHYSYEDNGKEIVAAFKKTIPNCIELLSTSDINSTCTLLSALDQELLANTFVDSFIEHHQKSRTRISLYLPNSQAIYPYLEKRIEEFDTRISSPDSLKDRLISCALSKSYPASELKEFSVLSAIEIYNILKSLHGTDTRTVANYLISFGSLSTPGDRRLQRHIQIIYVNSFEALELINNESLINKSRTQIFIDQRTRYLETKKAIEHFPDIS